MPNILFINGWRIFFYSNENNEPPHVHCIKGDSECKIWLIQNEFEIKFEYEYNISPSLRKEIRKIIFTHFEYIIESWNNHFGI